MRTYFNRITNRHLAQLISVYVILICVYVLVPESVESVRRALSVVEIGVLGAISVIIFDRMLRV
ncbi:MAG TPA: hypothetical protein VLF21_02980 [Candidatus Saccharimonadales bacterium]|nr:hypothetical protein [Candidatus Saccharimonadales bacterium]